MGVLAFQHRAAVPPTLHAHPRMKGRAVGAQAQRVLWDSQSIDTPFKPITLSKTAAVSALRDVMASTT